MANSMPDATKQVFDILEPFDSADRRKVVQAVLVLLGETAPAAPAADPNQHGRANQPDGAGLDELKPAARSWLRKHGLEMAALEHFIQIENASATVIELPGHPTSARQRTQTSYLMAGIAALFASGEPSFADSVARGYCEHFGGYDPNNHATSVKELGNKVTGSKDGGWKLTAPGLSEAASLIKANGK